MGTICFILGFGLVMLAAGCGAHVACGLDTITTATGRRPSPWPL
jgi:hypothetical protein